MPSTELLEDRELTLLAHHLLADIDPSRWRPEKAPKLRQGLQDVTSRMANHQRLEPLRAALEASLPPPRTTEQKRRWLAFKKKVQPAYAAVAARLKAEAVHVPALRPTNHARSLFHVTAAGLALAVITLAPPAALPWAAAAFAGLAWTLEAARRLVPRFNGPLMKLFGPVAHAHEHHRVNSATWYATALVLLALLATPLQAAVGVLVLGVGDPAAGYVGRRFGRRKLVGNRTLEGSLGFVAAGTAAAWLGSALFFPGQAPGLQGLAVALAGALCGAVAELVSGRLDDNFTIPLSSALGAAVALAALAGLH